MCLSSCLGVGVPEKLVVGDGFVDPMGFHDSTPTFSWKLPEGVKAQTAYRIETKGSEEKWDSGWVESDQSVFIPYGGKPLASRRQLEWRVRFRDERGEKSGWSKPAYLEMGLLSSRDWKAQWIGFPVAVDSDREPVAWLRHEFSIRGKIEHARLYVTARGLYEINLNGEKVGNDSFTPGWTSYGNRIDTITYDVTDALQQGGNAIGAELGMGWYAGHLAWHGKKNIYGKNPQLLLQLEISYKNGTSRILVSDEKWNATQDGSIHSSSIYHGEDYDARKEMPGWDKTGFDDSKWIPVQADTELGSERLVPKPFAPVRVTETLAAKKITKPVPGCFVFDLGQNMVGWAKLRLPVVEGQTTTVRFAEMLKQDGTLYTENYRTAKSTDTYTAAQTGTIEWRPTFTFHGFRYVELSGLPEGAKPELEWVTGEVMHSDLPRVGKFESSHAKLNQLYSSLVWGQRGNFVDIPTDCPQRDERFGWTGDAHVFCPTSMFNYDCLAFWKSWLGTMRDDQMEDGQIPDVIPDAINRHHASPGWMDAAIFIPWNLYVRTGDIDALTENYGMMSRLLGWYRSQAEGHLLKKIKGYSDWLQPFTVNPEGRHRFGDTPKPYIGTAFYAHSTQILADSARVLGKTADAQQLDAEVAAIKQAFSERYFDANGKLKNDPETQTAYLLALEFDLIPADLRDKAAENLVRLVHDADDHLRTGFLGTPYLTRVLGDTGHADLAYTVLFKETYPSWFYPINQGATTMWERWNSYSHKDGFGDALMNSFNHYAYGAIGQWMVERIAGLSPDPAHPGYKHFFIRPLVGGPLTSARAELETPYGKASSSWTKNGNILEMEVVVPPNTMATIEFPDGRKPETVSAGNHRFELELK